MVIATFPLTLPIIGVILALIMLESRGPAILRVTRKGKGSTTFQQYRFRCVYLDATNRPCGTTPHSKHDLSLDPRITTMGRFLLRSRLNTMPQIFNVIWGNMSIVGPSPELLVAVKQDPTLGHSTQSVAPGMICVSTLPIYASLNDCERYGIATAYSQNLNFGLDIKVILHSARQLIWPRQSRA